MSFVLSFGWTTATMEKMPCPATNGWKIGRKKIWSSNAKRTSSGDFQGTLVAQKVTLDMAFPANLTSSEIKAIKKYACPEDKKNKYCYIKFTNEEGETETKRCYFGEPQFDANIFMNGKYIWSSIQVQAVEK